MILFGLKSSNYTSVRGQGPSHRSKIFLPESCMKINEKLELFLMDENHFISLLFTLWAQDV
jgi:hypothetical protein